VNTFFLLKLPLNLPFDRQIDERLKLSANIIEAKIKAIN